MATINAAESSMKSAGRVQSKQVRSLELLLQTALEENDPKLALCHALRLEKVASAHPLSQAVIVRYADAKTSGQALDKLHRLSQTNSDAAYVLGEYFFERRQSKQASHFLGHALSLAPTYSEARILLATIQELSGDIVKAGDNYQKVFNDSQGRNDKAGIGAARAMTARGKFDEMRIVCEEVIELHPDHPSAHALLLSSRPSNQIQLIDRARQILNGAELTHDERVELNYAVGKALDRTGKHDEGYKFAANANGLQADAQPFDEAAVRKELDIEYQRAKQPSQGTVKGSGSTAPIFICGMPRSGTTLVESILSQHSKIEAGGELPFFRRTNRWLQDQPSPEACLSGNRERLASAYLGGLTARARNRPFLTDKMPENWRYLGTISQILGDVCVVRVKRDWRDVAISIFFEHFGASEAFAHSLEAIQKTIKLEEEAFQYWRGLLQQPIIEVCYEDLCRDPEAEIRNLLNGLNLEFEEACLEQDKSDANFLTPSKWQVRQKINASAIGRWKRFSDLPFADAELPPSAHSPTIQSMDAPMQ